MRKRTYDQKKDGRYGMTTIKKDELWSDFFRFLTITFLMSILGQITEIYIVSVLMIIGSSIGITFSLAILMLWFKEGSE